MKIGMQTWGSAGDINPFIALAGGLAAAGHDVTLAITSADRLDYTGIARRGDFRLGPVDHIGESEQALDRLGQRLFICGSPLQQLGLIINEMFEPCVAPLFRTAQALCERNDLIIGHFIVHPAQAAAAKAGKPYITVSLNHGSLATRYAPPPGLPDLGKWFNRVTWNISERVINRIVLPPINRLRNAQELPAALSYRDVWESPLANLIAVSPQFCPPRADWGANQQVCGFFRPSFLADDWDMPGDLGCFLDGGPPPVYVTFGSMMGTRGNALDVGNTTRLLIEAVRLADCRAIVQSRWNQVSGIAADENIYRIEAAPYERVFPRCAAIVHHGGAGTTQTASLCGRPSVVVAHIPDQFLWGRELQRLGVAPDVLDRRKLTARTLARRLRHVLDTPAMIDNAARLGNKLETEDGTRTAVRIIEQVTG